MSKFFDDISAAIKTIHHSHGVDDATLDQKIAEAIDETVTPLQSQLTEQQNLIEELQKALSDTVAALTEEDHEKALAIASAATNGTASATPTSTGDASASGESEGSQAAS